MVDTRYKGVGVTQLLNFYKGVFGSIPVFTLIVFQNEK
jgi:hypothetical protein